MSYTSVFGGTTIYPSDVSYLAISLTADKALEWPLESNDPSNPAARVIDVTTGGAYNIVLPDATQTGAGQTILFNNLSASTDSFTLRDYSGGVVAVIPVGTQWQVYLADTSTAAGTWRVFQYGASTATVQASALAGYGLTVTSNTLSQSTPVTTFNSSPRAALVTDRASMLTWVGTGAGTLDLPSTVAAGNNFVISARNSGGGDLTITPAGSETIDDAAALVLRPGDSTSLATNGLEWFTLGLGQQAVFAFDYTSIEVTGGTYTLAGEELNRIAYEFTGTLVSDLYVVVPSTIQQYWVTNATTGAYALYLQTAGGTPVGVGSGARGIYYCNGSQVVDADTSTVSLPVGVTDGGTGLVSYNIGDMLYANTSTTLAKLSDVAVGNVLRSGGVGVAPAWGKVNLATDASGALPPANGGTGSTAVPTNGQMLIGDGTTYVAATLTAGSGVSITNAAGAVTIAANGTVGTMVSFPSKLNPGAEWLPCNGAVVSQASYPALYSAVGLRSDTDLTTWTSRTNASGRTAVYGNGLFVTLTNSTAVKTSPDGVTWTSRTGASSAAYHAAIYANGLYVACGDGSTGTALQTSPDGINWTLRTSGATGGLRGVAYGNSIFVAVGAGTVVTSPDGITWTARVAPTTNTMTSIAFGDGRFMVVTSSTTYYSTDGIAWTNQAGPQTAAGYAAPSLAAVASGTYGARTFFAVVGDMYNSGLTTQYGFVAMSWDLGATWSYENITSSPLYDRVLADPTTGLLVARDYSGSEMSVSRDGGDTWGNITVGGSQSYAFALGGSVMYNSSLGTGYTTPLYTYNPATQFVLPSVPSPGTDAVPFIKAS